MTTEVSVDHEPEHVEHTADAAEVQEAVILAEHEAREEGRELSDLHATDAVIAATLAEHNHPEMEQWQMTRDQLSSLESKMNEHLLSHSVLETETQTESPSDVEDAPEAVTIAPQSEPAPRPKRSVLGRRR